MFDMTGSVIDIPVFIELNNVIGKLIKVNKTITN
jgi:hypothetical protein